MRHILQILLVIIILSSCAKEPQLSSKQVEVDFTSSGITRSGDGSGGAESYIFSLLVYPANSIKPNEGIYSAGEGGTLTRVGTGLVADEDYYRMIIASPANAMEQIGGRQAYGHEINRLSSNPYLSNPIGISIDGIRTNYRYIYDLGEVVLRQQRSKVKIRFKTSGDERTIKTLYFSNVYNNGYSCPYSKMLYDGIVAEDVYEFADFPNGVGEARYNSTAAVTATTTDIDGDTDYTYLLSDDYSKSDIGADVPFLTIGVLQGDKEKIVNLPIMIDMEPMTSYTYTISIESTEFYVTVTSSSWEDVTVGEGTFEEIAKYRININNGIVWDDSGEIICEILPPMQGDIEEIDYTIENSSNCYILNPSATQNRCFYIPIARIDEFWGDANYVSDADKRTSNVLSAVGDDWEVVMMWHDFNNSTTAQPISDLRLEKAISPSGEQAVNVFLPAEFADPASHCNIGYAVRKKSNKEILWSWHLWITDYDPNGLVEKYQSQIEANTAKAYGANSSGRKNEVHRYVDKVGQDPAMWDGDGIYKDKFIMDRNIGARSADFEGHGAIMDITSNKPGTLYYQFGRKDPFPRATLYSNGYSFSITGNEKYFFEVVNNPNEFIYSNNNWCSEADAQSIDILWNDYNITSAGYISGKSIFDPSPLGFRLPIDGTWNSFTGNNQSNETANPDYYSFYWTPYLTPIPDQYNYGRLYKNFAYYPASGNRSSVSGKLDFSGISGYYRSASPRIYYGKDNGCYLYFNSGYVKPSNSSTRTFGYPIRAIQE